MSQFTKSSQHPIDGFIIEFDRALRSIVGATPMRRPVPDSSTSDECELTAKEKKHAAGLMRVNHVGEVCAQALYQSQKLHAKSDDLKNKLTWSNICSHVVDKIYG
jgi:ubiquinone biosynthesis monooxygenase Coq7